MMTTLQNQGCVKSAKCGTGMVRLDLEFLMFFEKNIMHCYDMVLYQCLCESSIVQIDSSKQSAYRITPKM
jgi:hypothetical protein